MNTPHRKTFFALTLALLLAACGLSGEGPTPASPATESSNGMSTRTPSSSEGPASGAGSTPRAYDVAGLLAAPVAPGETVLLDAHHVDFMSWPGRGRFDGPCELLELAPLLDAPFAAQFSLFGRFQSIPIEIDPGAQQLFPLDLRPRGPEDGWTPLPLHGRFEGHLLGRAEPAAGTPTRPLAFSDTQPMRMDEEGYRGCPNADRIFVIERVAADLRPAEAMPGALGEPADWPVVRLEREGIEARRPPGWRTEVDEAGAMISLLAPAMQDGAEAATIRIAVQPDPTGARHDRLAATHELWTAYPQSAHTHHPVAPDTPPIDFETFVCTDFPPTCLIALHQDGDRLVEVAMDLPQPLRQPRRFTAPFTAIVDSLVLDTTPLKTATPPIRTMIGDGPFLSREEAEALARALVPDGDAWTIAPGRLVDEATARREAAAIGCDVDRAAKARPGEDQRVHPEAVWILRTGGMWEGEEMSYVTLVDAETRNHLCTEPLADGGAVPVETPEVDREQLERSLREDDHPLADDIHGAFAGTRRGIPSLDRILGDPLLPVFVHELAGAKGSMFQWVLHLAPQLGPAAVCGGGGCVVEGRDGKAFACPREAAGCTQLDGPSRCRLEHGSLRCRRLDRTLGWNSLTPRALCDPGPCVVAESDIERFVLLDGQGNLPEWPPGVDRLVVTSGTMAAENGSLVRVGIVQLSSVPAVLGLGGSESR